MDSTLDIEKTLKVKTSIQIKQHHKTATERGSHKRIPWIANSDQHLIKLSLLNFPSTKPHSHNN